MRRINRRKKHIHTESIEGSQACRAKFMLLLLWQHSLSSSLCIFVAHIRRWCRTSTIVHRKCTCILLWFITYISFPSRERDSTWRRASVCVLWCNRDNSMPKLEYRINKSHARNRYLTENTCHHWLFCSTRHTARSIHTVTFPFRWK